MPYFKMKNNKIRKIVMKIFRRNENIWDFIWENLAYWGANGVFLGQPFPYINIHIIVILIEQKVRNMISADAYLWHKVQALIRGLAEWAVSDKCLFFLSIHKLGFPRWRHKSFHHVLKLHLLQSCQNTVPFKVLNQEVKCVYFRIF